MFHPVGEDDIPGSEHGVVTHGLCQGLFADRNVGGFAFGEQQRCGVPVDHALDRPLLEDRAGAEEEALRLSKRIANLGTINPDAAEEYEELKRLLEKGREQP